MWLGDKGTATNVTYEGPELKGANNVVIPHIDHGETSYGPAAFAAMFRFLANREPASLEIQVETSITLSGKISGLAVESVDPKSGNFTNNLPLPGAKLEIFAVDSRDNAQAGSRIGGAVYVTTIGADGKWGPLITNSGGPFEFVISAPGYATTHIYRSPFPHSSSIVNMRAERIDDADKDARAIVIMTRRRGYFDVSRDNMRLDGQALPGVSPSDFGAGISTSKLLLKGGVDRAIVAEFNGERIAGRTWSANEGHLVYLEITR